MREHCQIDEALTKLGSRIDVFICCASYEARCHTIASRLEPSSVQRVLVVQNTDPRRYIRPNAEAISSRFGNASRNIVTDASDPLATADAIGEALDECASDVGVRCLVDITTFTHEALLILFRLLLLRQRPADEVVFAYTSASDYGTNTPDVEDKWLSKGLREVRTVLGYPGNMVPSHKNHLLVLVGFEHERASKLIEQFEPDEISLGHGTAASSVSGHHHKANTRFADLVAKAAARYGHVNRFEFSCHDPLDAKDAILQQARGFSGYNQVVAPMNTKPSTLGCALAALAEPAIQLCYSQPAIYNYAHYSSPSESCHLLKLADLVPLGGS